MPKGLSLLGFMDQAVALAYLEQRYITPDRSPLALLTTWQKAKQLLGPPLPRAGNPDIQPLADRPELLAVVRHPRFPELLREVRGYSFCLIEIDPLLCVQFDLVTEGIYPAPIGQAPPTLEELLPDCLPDHIDPVDWHVEEVSNNPRTTRIVAKELNFRCFPDRYLISGPQVGSVTVGVSCGTRLPWIRVSRFRGRCYLTNGYHRAYRYRLAGATHMPCLLLDVMFYKGTGGEEPGNFGRPQLEGPNPPTVGHFTQGRAYPVDIRLFERVIEVTWNQYTRPQTS
jgi:hypothetical protein